MKIKEIISTLILGSMFCMGVTICHAQEAAIPSLEQKKHLAPAVTPYHLEFVLSELEDGKRMNTRHYMMNLNSGRRENVKIGSRVPIETRGEITFIDVGTHITCELQERENGLSLVVGADISSLANHNTPPLLRHIVIEGSTVISAGKPVIIGSVDDPDSNHQFQLEVTATKLK